MKALLYYLKDKELFLIFNLFLMAITFLLLGSNLGDRNANMEGSIELLECFVGDIQDKSSVYESQPWGGVDDQPMYLNQVIRMETDLSPEELMLTNQQIEEKMGRYETIRWGARMMDIDILYYDDKVIQSNHLTIPHLQIQNRLFTLIPLAEIAPDYVHPLLKKTNTELLNKCTDKLGVKLFA